MLEKIRSVASREHLSIHNVTTHLTERGIWIDLDLEVDPDISFERAHVGVTPGIDFGRNAEGYLRFSYAASLERTNSTSERSISLMARPARQGTRRMGARG